MKSRIKYIASKTIFGRFSILKMLVSLHPLLKNQIWITNFLIYFFKELQFDKKSNLAASSLYKLQFLQITKKLVIGIWFGTFWKKVVELLEFALKCLFWRKKKYLTTKSSLVNVENVKKDQMKSLEKKLCESIELGSNLFFYSIIS